MENTRAGNELAKQRNNAFPKPSGTRLRLRITAAAESILRRGHPWLFAESIKDQNRPGELGELAVVYDRQDRFLALGLFDPCSAIRVRVLQTGRPRQVNSDYWRERLEQALERRNGLFDEQTTGWRWIHGENDGWPGLVLDRYDQTLVLKLYTAAWLPWLGELVKVISKLSSPERIVLRLSRNVQKLAKDRFGNNDGDVVAGAKLHGAVTFLESGLVFEADVMRGQKTGFFLDQRENRLKVATLAPGRRVLNAFSFSGGFSVHAAAAGARSMADLDISAHALATSKRNFTLNESSAKLKACTKEWIQADAFEWLAGNPSRKFDLIVLDPPSMAKRETERAGAIQAYRKLASLGISHLGAGGILVACSCSAHVAEAEFFAAVQAGARQSKSAFKELARTGHPSDHPATFEEGKYLKAIYLQFK